MVLVKATPTDLLKICRGCLFVYSGAIISQVAINSPLSLHALAPLFLWESLRIKLKNFIHEGWLVAMLLAPFCACVELFKIVFLMEEEFLVEILLVQADVLEKI